MKFFFFFPVPGLEAGQTKIKIAQSLRSLKDVVIYMLGDCEGNKHRLLTFPVPRSGDGNLAP